MVRRSYVLVIVLLLLGSVLGPVYAERAKRIPAKAKDLLPTERLVGRGVWVDPFIETRLEKAPRVRVTAWFREQLLGDGGAYLRRAKEFAKRRRGELRIAATKTLKDISERTWKTAGPVVAAGVTSGAFRNVDRHWVVNGFSCGVTKAGLKELKALKGVSKIFAVRGGGRGPQPVGEAPSYGVTSRPGFDPARYKHPWYVRYLQADKVWTRFGVTGKGTLNIVHDHNFVFSENLTGGVYRNGRETPGNGIDDDGNGLIDDYHGFNFDHGGPGLTTMAVGPRELSGQKMHGFMCAAIICGTGAKDRPFELGIAPEGRWAGVIASLRLEAAVQWAVEQQADTYSMSFSIPGQGEYRSHRRKVMEHASLCGVFFVSGAGNFAQNTQVPVQMRQPEDIPNVVFSAAGVQRDLTRTAFSSKGPVDWSTEHYAEGSVRKPEVCAFNANLPFMRLDGTVRPGGLGGNSFAGPMFCGTIALMISADPDLLPWDLMDIITSTAMDVAAKGYDDETGHGLINCFRAVKEVLRRKAKREGKPAAKYTGREKGDVLDVAALKRALVIDAVVVQRLGPKGQAKTLGMQVGDQLVSYNGVKIKARADLQAAKKAADAAQAETVLVVVTRAGKKVEFTFKAGPLGINAGERYKEPVFQ